MRRWMGLHAIRRELMLAIDPELFPDVEGSTDTEIVFHLALTFGLEDDPVEALERTVGTEGPARSLFASADVDTIRDLHPDNECVQRLTGEDRVIVSEPFSDLPGIWVEIPEATAVTVRGGGVLEQRPFRPRQPAESSAVLSAARSGDPNTTRSRVAT